MKLINVWKSLVILLESEVHEKDKKEKKNSSSVLFSHSFTVKNLL